MFETITIGEVVALRDSANPSRMNAEAAYLAFVGKSRRMSTAYLTAAWASRPADAEPFQGDTADCR
jgi:hypothetical protein